MKTKIPLLFFLMLWPYFLLNAQVVPMYKEFKASIFLRDHSGNPVMDNNVTLVPTEGGKETTDVTFFPKYSKSSNKGEAVFTIQVTSPGKYRIYASVDGLYLKQTIDVETKEFDENSMELKMIKEDNYKGFENNE